MLIDFPQLPDSSRIWIYQADRSFTKNEAGIISDILSSFLQQWTAHGHQLQGAFDLPFNHFIIIGLNELVSDASGCSIDSLFRAIQETTAKTGIDFLNRELIAFKEGEMITLSKRAALKGRFASDAPTFTFNNLVNVKADIQSNWIVPVKDTWLNRYLAPVSV